MKKEKVNRSPLFYVGDKYKLIKEIKGYFPASINRFFEPFVGGGSVFLNVKSNEYFLNDIDTHVVELHEFLCSHVDNTDEFFKIIFSLIDKYSLSCSYKEDIVPEELKRQYKKTYYSRFNKTNYTKLKKSYNKASEQKIAELYVLLIYGFNRMLRFNSKGEFNLPVGNVDFNKNVYDALCNYFEINRNRQIHWSSLDFRDFFNSIIWQEDDFVYLDPPYLITFSEYNKYWNEQTESDLLAHIDDLNSKSIKFAVSNVTHYKGKENTLFLKWAEKYNVHSISSNYISYHDNTIKDFKEVLVTNYINEEEK